MSRVERFSQRTRQILAASQQEAEASRSPSIETAHVLLGILRSTDSVACRVLNDLRVNYDRVLPIVISAHPGEPSPTQPVIAPETKRLIESATKIARERRDPQIGSEHLLLALVKGDDKSIRYLMRQINLEPEVVRSCVERVLRDERPNDLAETKPFVDDSQGALELALEHEESEDLPTMPQPAEPPIRARVIKLVEDGKISAQEAAELLKAMRLAAVPLDDDVGYVLLPLGAVNFDDLRQRSVRVAWKARPGAPTGDVKLPFEQVQNNLLRFLSDAYQGSANARLDLDSAQGRLTISIE